MAAPKRRQCGAMEVHERISEAYPPFRERQNSIERYTARSLVSGRAQRWVEKTVTIQVVVHVVFKRDEENISDEQIRSQIDVLNTDYNAENKDAAGVPPAWSGLVANPNIRFALAKRDPQGKKTSGITRTPTARDTFGTQDAVKSKKRGGADPWPSTRYLNIWVCNLGGGLLGYAQFPGGPAKTDGVVILHTAFGTTGTATEPFNLGRTATHETGHWLNLRHIWGDRNDCGGTDFCSDTPNQQLPNYGKPTFPHISCNNGPNGDMFMNYMDYVDDAAMFMFTPAQVTRMNAALFGPRRTLAR